MHHLSKLDVMSGMLLLCKMACYSFEEFATFARGAFFRRAPAANRCFPSSGRRPRGRRRNTQGFARLPGTRAPLSRPAKKGARTGSVSGHDFLPSPNPRRHQNSDVDSQAPLFSVFTLRAARTHDEAQSRNAQRTARHTCTGSHTLYKKLVQLHVRVHLSAITCGRQRGCIFTHSGRFSSRFGTIRTTRRPPPPFWLPHPTKTAVDETHSVIYARLPCHVSNVMVLHTQTHQQRQLLVAAVLLRVCVHVCPFSLCDEPHARKQT